MDDFKSVNRKRAEAGLFTPQDYSTFVGMYYEMNPETDEILFSSDLLRNGMTVLIENKDQRVEIEAYDGIDRVMSSGEHNRARKYNQWVTVSQVYIDHNNQSVKFIGTDPSGVGRIYFVDFVEAWLVKKGYDSEGIDSPIIIPLKPVALSDGIIFYPSSKAFLYGGERIDATKETWVDPTS